MTDGQGTPPPGADDALYERLAAIQHDIWSHWMRYLLGSKTFAITSEPTGRGMRTADVVHWQRQIDTPYADLTEAEKASDREQVDRYWHLVGPAERGEDVAGVHDLKTALIMSLGDSGVMLSDEVLDRVVERTTRALGRRWDSLLRAVSSEETRDA